MYGHQGDVFRGHYGNGEIARPGEATSSLNPPSNWARMQEHGGGDGYAWVRPQLYYPTPQILEGPNIAYSLRQRTFNFTGLNINAAMVQRIAFDTPGPIYQFTGSAILNNGAALPIGRDPLDTFRVQFQQANGDLLTENPVLGSCILGSGKLPTFTGRSAWLVDNGSTLICTLIPLFADLEVDIVAWHYEVRGPTNLART